MRARGAAGSTRAKLSTAVEFLGVGACTLMFLLFAAGLCVTLAGKHAAGSRDFVEYWASGQQLVHHANPYDRSVIQRMETSLGYVSPNSILVMGNPPTALVLVFPLGWLGSRAALLLWSLLLLACLAASVRMVWSLHGRPASHLSVLGYSFAPALVCVLTGQISIFILFGLVLFLRFHRSRPFAAGACLWFCALKPQLFLPLGLVLLAWIVATRSYRILGGAASALGLSAAIAATLDPAAWTQYRQMMSAARYDLLPIPCVSIVLRRSLAPGAMWLQYLPAALGCVWALVYFRRWRGSWDWMQHGSPILLVSVLVAPYTWFVDQAVLIPALLHGVYVTRSRGWLLTLALASAVIEAASVRGVPLMQSRFYLWTAPAWLGWYLLATRAGKAEGLRDLSQDEEGVQPALAIEALSAAAPWVTVARTDEGWG